MAPKKRVKIDCYACDGGWITQGGGGRAAGRGSGKGDKAKIRKRRCPICGGPPGKKTVWQ